MKLKERDEYPYQKEKRKKKEMNRYLNNEVLLLKYNATCFGIQLNNFTSKERAFSCKFAQLAAYNNFIDNSL